MILNKLNQSMYLKREVFDASNPKHIEEVKYFMKNSIRGRFESMAQRASLYKPADKNGC